MKNPLTSAKQLLICYSASFRGARLRARLTINSSTPRRFNHLDNDFAGACSKTPTSTKSGEKPDRREEARFTFGKCFFHKEMSISWMVQMNSKESGPESPWIVTSAILPISLYYPVLILSIYLLIMRKNTRPHKTPSRCSQPPRAPRTTTVFSLCLIMVLSQMWECGVQTCWSIWGDCKI